MTTDGQIVEYHRNTATTTIHNVRSMMLQGIAREVQKPQLYNIAYVAAYAKYEDAMHNAVASIVEHVLEETTYMVQHG